MLPDNGTAMAVLRPADPELALKLTVEWSDRVVREKLSPAASQEAFDAILRAQEYTYVGAVRAGGSDLVDPETGEPCGVILPGDSLVPYESLTKMVKK